MKASPSRANACSTAGWRPPSMRKQRLSSHMRPHIILHARQLGQRGRAIERGQRGGRGGDGIPGGQHRAGKLLEQRQFPRQRLAGSVENAAFERGQLVRGERTALASVCLWRKVAECSSACSTAAVPGADLHEIAEHLIILDFQRLDAGLRGVTRLQLGEHNLGVRRRAGAARRDPRRNRLR